MFEIRHFTSTKVYNKFPKNSNKKQLESDERFVSFVGCDFEQNKNSKSSIDFVENKDFNQIEFVHCDFKGKLEKGSHYIDGMLKNKNSLNVKSCNFEDEVNEQVNIKLIDNESDIFFEKNLNQSNFMKKWSGAVICILIFTLLVLKLNDSKDDYLEEFIVL